MKNFAKKRLDKSLLLFPLFWDNHLRKSFLPMPLCQLLPILTTLVVLIAVSEIVSQISLMPNTVTIPKENFFYLVNI